MRLLYRCSVTSILVLVIGNSVLAASADTAAQDLAAARRVGWQAAITIVEKLESNPMPEFTGIEAWRRDLRRQTAGLDPQTPVDTWPRLDAESLMTRNPAFWQAFYEIAPGDAGLGLLQAGLLLSCGEATRAFHVLEFQQFRAGTPEEIRQIIRGLLAMTQQAQKESDAHVQAGIALFDGGDYAGAVRKYREALQVWPQNGWAYYELGYTLRTQQYIAAGEKPETPNGVSVRVNEQVKLKASAEVIEAYAKCRQHAPFQYMAYQGEDQEVLQGLLALTKKAAPAMKTLGQSKDSAVVSPALQQLSEGCQEAGAHELALVVRQLLVARRGRYDPTDHPFIATSLRKLAPGVQTEETLRRLAGANLVSRQLIVPETAEQPPDADTTYRNPIDGKAYVAPQGWKTYQPQRPAVAGEKSSNVKIDHLRLLSNETQIEARTTAEDLSRFVNRAAELAQTILGKSEKPFKVLVQFKCSPAKVEFQMAHQPQDADAALLREFHQALQGMKPLAVKSETVEFQLQVSVEARQKAK